MTKKRKPGSRAKKKPTIKHIKTYQISPSERERRRQAASSRPKDSRGRFLARTASARGVVDVPSLRIDEQLGRISVGGLSPFY